VEFRQSLISAHHNYLINQMLTPGFILGDPHAGDDFWLLADVLLPGEKAPYLSGRFYGQKGNFLLRLGGGEVIENPGNCLSESSSEGFRLLYPSGEVLLSLHMEIFANGYLTRVQGKLYDRKGSLRMEPSFESAKVFGGIQRVLDAPVRFQEKASCL
jgi:hypothetical protein